MSTGRAKEINCDALQVLRGTIGRPCRNCAERRMAAVMCDIRRGFGTANVVGCGRFCTGGGLSACRGRFSW